MVPLVVRYVLVIYTAFELASFFRSRHLFAARRIGSFLLIINFVRRGEIVEPFFSIMMLVFI